MSQLNTNVIAPLGYTGPNLTGDNNDVQIIDESGNNVFRTTIDFSVAVGEKASAGPRSTSLGYNALAISAISPALNNTAIGHQALLACYGVENTAIGSDAGRLANAAEKNTFVGFRAGENVSSGDNNVLLGWSAGRFLTTGSNNVCLGDNTQTATPTTSNSITLGNGSHNVLRCAVTSITSLSDERDKKEIQELPVGLEFIEKLKPVKFVWNDREEEGKHDIEDFGFIAQDLKATQEESEASYLNLVYDENPEKLEASYGKLLPILVKAIQEMSSEIKLLKEEILTLKTK